MAVFRGALQCQRKEQKRWLMLRCCGGALRNHGTLREFINKFSNIFDDWSHSIDQREVTVVRSCGV